MSNLRSNARLKIFTREDTLILDSSYNNTLLSVTTQKELSNSTGFFSINLSPRLIRSQSAILGTTSIENIIQPYDLVEISFKTDEDYKVEMIGFVSRAAIALVVDPSNGVPNRQLQITGFDMSRALQNFKIFFNPYVIDKNLACLGGQIFYNTEKYKDVLSQKNVVDFIRAFVNQAFTNVFNNANSSTPYFGYTFGGRSRANLSVPFAQQSTVLDPGGFALPLSMAPYSEYPGIKIPDLVDFQGGMSTVFQTNLMNNPFILLNLAAGEEVSVWDILKSYSDPPFHECFIDLRRAQTYNYPIKNPDGIEYSPKVKISDLGLIEGLAPGAEATIANGVAQIKYDVASAEMTHSIDNFPLEFPNTPLVFYLRTTPFSPNSWNNLNSHHLLTTDIMVQNTATSEENIYNYYIVICTNDAVIAGTPQLAAIAFTSYDPVLGRPKVPIYDTESTLKYGLRQFPIQQTKYVDFISEDVGGILRSGIPNDMKVIKATSTMTRQLFRWYAYGEEFETGTISCKGRVGIGPKGVSIGSRLVECFPDGSPTGKEYYIEGVAQDWMAGTPLKTTITVTRGHFPTARFEKIKTLEAKLGVQQNGNGNLFYPMEEDSYTPPAIPAFTGS